MIWEYSIGESLSLEGTFTKTGCSPDLQAVDQICSLQVNAVHALPVAESSRES